MGLFIWVFIGIIYMGLYWDYLLVLWVLFIGLFIDDKWQYYGFNYMGLYWVIYGVIFY